MFFTSFWIFVVNVALLLLFRFSKTTSTNHDGELLTTTVNDMLRLAAAAKLLLKLSLILFLLLSSFSSREIVGGRRKKKMVYRSLSFSYVLPLVASRCSSPYSVVVPTIFQPFFWLEYKRLIWLHISVLSVIALNIKNAGISLLPPSTGLQLLRCTMWFIAYAFYT